MNRRNFLKFSTVASAGAALEPWSKAQPGHAATAAKGQVASPNALPAGVFTAIRTDAVGARRGSAIRYAPDRGAFFLWGFMNANPDLLQELPVMEIPEYDMVRFEPAAGRWQNDLPPDQESEWSRKLPLAYIPRTYAGITTGSERTVLRGPAQERGGVPRPDLNIVFDQVVWHPKWHELVYFTGGLTAAYSVEKRRWRDVAPWHSPPPILGGSLAYDPVNDEVALFGGGHVAEPGPDGTVVGYTGTWVLRDSDWQRLATEIEPPPRMVTRLVTDTKNQVLVVFGGDGQSHYLADTWLYDLKTRTWRASKSSGGPEPRAGHFTVFDPESGCVLIGGGHNRRDLTDLWAYDAAQDQWKKLNSEVPTGFYLSADIAPEKKLILLVTCNRKPNDHSGCNVLFPVRTTYGYSIDSAAIQAGQSATESHEPMVKFPSEESWPISQSASPSSQVSLDSIPANKWIDLGNSGRTAPLRTWGSATFDTDRGQIVYWGGGHCGYQANNVDVYEVESRTWRSLGVAESPERLWNHGVRLAGVTFQGGPWTHHGRKTYAYDPVSRKLIVVRPIRLTTGYDPSGLESFPDDYSVAVDALVRPPSCHMRWATWTFDLETGKWELLCEAPVGADALVSTPEGAGTVYCHWRQKLDDAGYLLPWNPTAPPDDTAFYLLNVAEKRWKRVTPPQTSPQFLYEMTSLAYDSKRHRVILHGGGAERNELWMADLSSGRWTNMQPKVASPAGSAPPTCGRESVYIPESDTLLTFAWALEPARHHALGLYAYEADKNTWRKVNVEQPPEVARSGENRSMVYDPKRGLALLVIGTNDNGGAQVFGLRYNKV